MTPAARARRAERRGYPRLISPDALADRLPASRVALCLDYDGTLVPIAPRPESATFDPAGRDLLRRLARLMPVALVSGRARATLRALIGLRSPVYVGNHGWEIGGPGIRFDPPLPPRWRADLDRMLNDVRALSVAGVLIEHKGITASLHYRLVAAPHRRRWLRAVRSRLAPWVAARRVALVDGYAVIELRPPRAWNKGTAVRWLLSRPGWHGRTPVYLGDDATDEDAFQAIRSRGIGVLIGSRRLTAARFRVSNPAAVRRLLTRWLPPATCPEPSRNR
ncbi:MAG: trehalose-phosphatase [Nitrospiria bacterium]